MANSRLAVGNPREEVAPLGGENSLLRHKEVLIAVSTV